MELDNAVSRLSKALKNFGFYIASYPEWSSLRDRLTELGIAHLLTTTPLGKYYILIEPNTKHCNSDCKAECMDKRGNLSTECFYRCVDLCTRSRVEQILSKLSRELR